MFNRTDAKFNRRLWFNRSPGVYASTPIEKVYTDEPKFNRSGFNTTPYNSKSLIEVIEFGWKSKARAKMEGQVKQVVFYGKSKVREIYSEQPLFNRMMFNTTPFNTKHLLAELGWGSQARSSQRAIAVFSGKGQFRSQARADLYGVRVQFTEAHFRAMARSQLDFVRVRFSEADWRVIVRANFRALRYFIDFIEFTGDFAPDDVIEIDLENFIVKLNGEYVLEQVNRDWFNLNPGKNLLIYEDSAGSREVKINVKHTGRWT